VTISASSGAARTATLTVTLAAPAAPSLVSPASGSTVSLPIALDWTDVSAAATYQLQIDDSSGFSAPRVVDQTVTSSQFTVSSLATQQHWWRVRGINSTGTAGAWSSVRSFTPQGPPPPPGSALTVTVTASGRSGQRITSSPTGINVPVGSSGSASFTAGTAITLTVSNGRDAIWSGACSTGASRSKTCRFTPTADSSVTANVQ
jgi:predicted phage tail protein